MKTVKHTLFIAISVAVLASCCFVSTSCSEDNPESCLCGTSLVNEGISFANIQVNTLSLGENSQNYLTYYNGRYFIKQTAQEDTNYYFVCNPEKIPEYNAAAKYNVTGNAWTTSNVILQQLFKDKTHYYEFEVTSAEKIPQQTEEK